MFLEIDEFVERISKIKAGLSLLDYDGVILHYLRGLGESQSGSDVALGTLVWECALRSLGVQEDHMDSLLAIRKVKGAGAWPLIAKKMEVKAREYGYSFTTSEILAALDEGGPSIIQTLGPPGVPLYSGSHEFLNLLRHSFSSTCIVTSCVESIVNAQLAVHGLDSHISTVWGCGMTQAAGLPYKPEPDIWKHVVETHPLAQSDILIAEDNPKNCANALTILPKDTLCIFFTREDSRECSNRSERALTDAKQALISCLDAKGADVKQVCSRILVHDPLHNEQGFNTINARLRKGVGAGS